MSHSTVWLVSNVDHVRENIDRYNMAMSGPESPEQGTLIDIIPHIQSWIVMRDVKTGETKFSPSKFCGYADMSANIYHKNHEEMDGRLTERVLAPWIRVVSRTDPAYAELQYALNKFCAKFGKRANSRCRISELKGVDEGASKNSSDVLVDLLEQVYQTLSSAQQQDIRRRIARI